MHARQVRVNRCAILSASAAQSDPEHSKPRRTAQVGQCRSWSVAPFVRRQSEPTGALYLAQKQRTFFHGAHAGGRASRRRKTRAADKKNQNRIKAAAGCVTTRSRNETRFEHLRSVRCSKQCHGRYRRPTDIGLQLFLSDFREFAEAAIAQLVASHSASRT